MSHSTFSGQLSVASILSTLSTAFVFCFILIMVPPELQLNNYLCEHLIFVSTLEFEVHESRGSAFLSHHLRSFLVVDVQKYLFKMNKWMSIILWSSFSSLSSLDPWPVISNFYSISNFLAPLFLAWSSRIPNLETPRSLFPGLLWHRILAGIMTKWWKLTLYKLSPILTELSIPLAIFLITLVSSLFIFQVDHLKVFSNNLKLPFIFVSLQWSHPLLPQRKTEAIRWEHFLYWTVRPQFFSPFHSVFGIHPFPPPLLIVSPSPYHSIPFTPPVASHQHLYNVCLFWSFLKCLFDFTALSRFYSSVVSSAFPDKYWEKIVQAQTPLSHFHWHTNPLKSSFLLQHSFKSFFPGSPMTPCSYWNALQH